MSDLRQAWRMLGRMPGLSAVVIISLGVGIGVNTGVFSWIQALVLEPTTFVGTMGTLSAEGRWDFHQTDGGGSRNGEFSRAS